MHCFVSTIKLHLAIIKKKKITSTNASTKAVDTRMATQAGIIESMKMGSAFNYTIFRTNLLQNIDLHNVYIHDIPPLLAICQ